MNKMNLFQRKQCIANVHVSGTCFNVQRCLEDNVEEDNVVSGRSVEGLNDLRPKR